MLSWKPSRLGFLHTCHSKKRKEPHHCPSFPPPLVLLLLWNVRRSLWLEQRELTVLPPTLMDRTLGIVRDLKRCTNILFWARNSPFVYWDQVCHQRSCPFERFWNVIFNKSNLSFISKGEESWLFSSHFKKIKWANSLESTQKWALTVPTVEQNWSRDKRSQWKVGRIYCHINILSFTGWLPLARGGVDARHGHHSQGASILPWTVTASSYEAHILW